MLTLQIEAQKILLNPNGLFLLKFSIFLSKILIIGYYSFKLK